MEENNEYDQNAPTTSAAYLTTLDSHPNAVDESTDLIREHMNESDDQSILAAVENHESQLKKNIQRIELELFWDKLEEKHKSERNKITHRHNLAKIKLKDRVNKEIVKNELEDMFWPISGQLLPLKFC